MLLLLIAVPVGAGDLDLHGHFTPGGLVFGRTCADCQVVFQGRQVPVTATGDFIIGFARDAALTKELLVQTPDGQVRQQPLQLEPRDYRMQRIDGISQRLMEPSPEDLERIGREAVEIAAVRQQFKVHRNFLEAFSWPLTGRITGVYGSQRIFNGEPRQPHFGIDIAAPTGTPVKAPAGGVVTYAHPGMFFAGTTLVVNHGHGLSSTFLHLHEILVEVGQEVTQGQIIATVGATGRVTGPHLDWRLNWFDVRLDPALLVGAMPN
ncbi:M23 family metallopeptidase [Pelobacter sp. M08fum]|uniref:M23 family metallopeptidase n=1 Tax=Pelovirga terrestris TaxID=2771352 RepID=A0A8J6QRQ0_9BACT|nr:M23 family metallopeptidase [Pelovirga terrestris]